MITKSVIREEFKSVRKSLTYTHLSQQAILVNLKKAFGEILETVVQDSLIVGLYNPIDDEVDVLPFFDWLAAKGIRFSIPKIKSKKSLDMDFILFKPGEETKKSIFSFFEPSSDEAIEPNIIILPLLACDMEGNRIGYGKGYYDKYLAKAKLAERSFITIGICYEEQIYKGTLPKEAHDQNIGVIVTQKRIYYPSMAKY
jgi:5-formyltetrahydrofolate cyclo-ligase